MIDQIGIACTGVVAIWLTQQFRTNWKRYACLFGMTGQFFWLNYCYTNEAWGILILTFFYTYSWGLGIWNNWIKGAH